MVKTQAPRPVARPRTLRLERSRVPSWKHLTKTFVPAAFLAFGLQPPAAAEGQSASEDALVALRALDARILETGDRLALANVDLCADQGAIPGVAVHDLAQYAPDARAAAARAFHLGEEPAVLAVSPEGAAARAGLRADDGLIAADGMPFGAASLPDRASFASVESALDVLDSAFADGSAELEVRRGGERVRLQVGAPSGCRGRFQLVPGDQLNAGADGRYIQISSALALYAADEDELAAILAHELAHNILRHRVRLNEAGISRGLLKTVGRNARLIRETEVEADRLSIYLLDRAGYDTGAAAQFWSRFGPEHGYGIFASPTHPGWRKRVVSFEEEIATLARLKQQGPNPVPPVLAAPLPRLE